MAGLGIPRALFAVRISLVTTCHPSGLGLPYWTTRWCGCEPHGFCVGKPRFFFLDPEMMEHVGKSGNVWSDVEHVRALVTRDKI